MLHGWWLMNYLHTCCTTGICITSRTYTEIPIDKIRTRCNYGTWIAYTFINVWIRLYIDLLECIPLPSWHVVPVYPASQVHQNMFIPSWQVDKVCSHGVLAHSLIFVWQYRPVYPATHVHAKLFIESTHPAPFWHVTLRHSSMSEIHLLVV